MGNELGNPNDDEAPRGFLEPWFWNFFLAMYQYGSTIGCSALGFMGLFWWHDAGLMMNRCFLLTPGQVVQYESLPEYS